MQLMKSGTPGPLKASGPRPLLCSEQTLPIFLASSWWGSMPLAWVLISKPDFIGAPGDHGARHCQSDPVRFKTWIFESKAWETNMMGGSFHPFGNRTSPSRASLTLVSPPWMWRPVRNLLCVGLPPQLYYCRIYRVGMYCTDCLWLFNLLTVRHFRGCEHLPKFNVSSTDSGKACMDEKGCTICAGFLIHSALANHLFCWGAKNCVLCIFQMTIQALLDLATPGLTPSSTGRLLFQQIQHLFQTLSNPQDMNFEMTKTQYLVPSDKQPVLTMNTESFGGKRSWSISSGSCLALYIVIIVIWPRANQHNIAWMLAFANHGLVLVQRFQMGRCENQCGQIWRLYLGVTGWSWWGNVKLKNGQNISTETVAEKHIKTICITKESVLKLVGGQKALAYADFHLEFPSQN